MIDQIIPYIPAFIAGAFIGLVRGVFNKNIESHIKIPNNLIVGLVFVIGGLGFWLFEKDPTSPNVIFFGLGLTAFDVRSALRSALLGF